MTNPSSRSPSNDDSLIGAFRVAQRKGLERVDDMLPVRVIDYDRASNRARVEHQIQMVTTDGDLVDRSQVASVPALSLGGGGFTINFHLPEGSLGWIKANDRDISLFLQSYSKRPPNDRRIHDFSSGLFIPDVMTGYTIADEDSQACVLQSLDGSVRISLNNERIKFVVGGQDVLTMTDKDATFGVPIIDMNGVIHDNHNHTQGNDSDGNSEQDTAGPQNP